jgi:hypothetical protein
MLSHIHAVPLDNSRALTSRSTELNTGQERLPNLQPETKSGRVSTWLTVLFKTFVELNLQPCGISSVTQAVLIHRPMKQQPLLRGPLCSVSHCAVQTTVHKLRVIILRQGRRNAFIFNTEIRTTCSINNQDTSQRRLISGLLRLVEW